ncbi:nucleoside recognition domain-containing protein [Cohnella thailandensis]|uniref:Ferrous iron transporter B n=1 Tax=Cohnella thailandensis TaxID=557557 RepID=A0A841STI4_9BACL|nr:nucleoside recognition domain-containing protein [Cohnella thailandensis]MBB6633345.1 ferrous iron transporter B [Cohnella thailandensis]MBP1977313.1 Fe2+ transport system protein B [Cohnella thailandensis]
MLNGAMSQPSSMALIGFESSGKSALFRSLTGDSSSEVANFRGSTVMARRGSLAPNRQIVDLPGIRLQDDSVTTRLALEELNQADMALLVVRATHSASELPHLLELVRARPIRVALLLTFADKVPSRVQTLVQTYKEQLGIPVYAADARFLDSASREQILESAANASTLRRQAAARSPMEFMDMEPPTTWLEIPVWGRLFAILLLLSLFAFPVFLAYHLSSWLQPIVDGVLVPFVVDRLSTWPEPMASLLIGDYGVITLGWYSFLWAFPVVLLLSVTIAIGEESGIKDRITDSLDPWMRVVGLSGRDLVPVLSGFGCNVVAVHQSRACSACSRKSCVSLIAFGSACSYQIGASLSLFSSAGHPVLFLPYLLLLTIVGAIHTRVWNRRPYQGLHSIQPGTTFLQVPALKAVLWRVRNVLKQFLLQAMPIFLLLCIVSTILQETGVIGFLTELCAPLMQLLHLPAEAAGGILFSILRKDGLLVLNQDNGAFLSGLHAGQLFVLVYLASTLTACLVTLWTIRKEMGLAFAASMASKQAATSVISAVVLMLLVGR